VKAGPVSASACAGPWPRDSATSWRRRRRRSGSRSPGWWRAWATAIPPSWLRSAPSGVVPAPKPCPAGVGVKGGTSRGKGLGSRLRLWVCGCEKPVQVRVASDDFRAPLRRLRRGVPATAERLNEETEPECRTRSSGRWHGPGASSPRQDAWEVSKLKAPPSGYAALPRKVKPCASTHLREGASGRGSLTGKQIANSLGSPALLVERGCAHHQPATRARLLRHGFQHPQGVLPRPLSEACWHHCLLCLESGKVRTDLS